MQCTAGRCWQAAQLNRCALPSLRLLSCCRASALARAADPRPLPLPLPLRRSMSIDKLHAHVYTPRGEGGGGDGSDAGGSTVSELGEVARAVPRFRGKHI